MSCNVSREDKDGLEVMSAGTLRLQPGGFIESVLHKSGKRLGSTDDMDLSLIHI